MVSRHCSGVSSGQPNRGTHTPFQNGSSKPAQLCAITVPPPWTCRRSSSGKASPKVHTWGSVLPMAQARHQGAVCGCSM